MIWIDWLILAILAYNVGSGLFTGLLRSLVNLVALITAYLLTPVLKLPLSQLLQANLLELPAYLALPLSTALTWTGIYVLISGMGLFFAKTMDQTLLKPVDRLGGAALGLFVASLLILLPLTAVRALPFLQKMPAVQETLGKSMLVPMLNPAVELVQHSLGPAVLNYWLKPKEQERMEDTLPASQPSASPASPGSPGSPRPGSHAPPR